MSLRIALSGVSHWHTRHYVLAVADDPDVEIVGVADSSRAVGEWAARTGARAFADYREMCETVHPDLVVGLGRPVDMAGQAEFLLGTGIPSVLEKPCGTSVAELSCLSEIARQRALFAAVPFPYRYSPIVSLVHGQAAGDGVVYATFRQVPGPTARYRDWGVEWNLDPATAGGGCTLNLSVHYYDLARVLVPDVRWEVVDAYMSGFLSGEAVEDFSLTVLRAGERYVLVETGYAETGTGGDTSLVVDTRDMHVLWDGRSRSIAVTRAGGATESVPAAANQAAYYQTFMLDVLARLKQRRPPPSGLDDMLEAAKMAERAYQLAGRRDLMGMAARRSSGS